MNNLRMDQMTAADRLDRERRARDAREYLFGSLAWELRLRELREAPVAATPKGRSSAA
jgi:hypothetical protein